MSNISDIIKRLRAKPFCLSQTEIERRTGISQSKISRWENGDAASGAEDALKLVALAESLDKGPQRKAKAVA